MSVRLSDFPATGAADVTDWLIIEPNTFTGGPERIQVSDFLASLGIGGSGQDLNATLGFGNDANDQDILNVRQLINGSYLAIDVPNRTISDTAGNMSADFVNCTLINPPLNQVMINWVTGNGYDQNGAYTLGWDASNNNLYWLGDIGNAYNGDVLAINQALNKSFLGDGDAGYYYYGAGSTGNGGTEVGFILDNFYEIFGFGDLANGDVVALDLNAKTFDVFFGGFSYFGVSEANSSVYVGAENGIANNSLVTDVAGSTSGAAHWSMPEQGSSHKKVIINFDAMTDAGFVVTFPTAFTYPPAGGPALISGSIGAATITTTSVTFAASAAGVGVFIIEGF